MYYILMDDKTPKEVSVQEWDEWWTETRHQHPERCWLLTDRIGDIEVKTIFHRGASPYIGFFETRVKNLINPNDEKFYEHQTYEEAKAYHQGIVSALLA